MIKGTSTIFGFFAPFGFVYSRNFAVNVYYYCYYYCYYHHYHNHHHYYYYTRSTEGWMGVYWIHPDVSPSICQSLRPSVDKVSGTFWKKNIGSIYSIPSIYPYGVSLLTLFIFVFLASFVVLWWPNIWPKMWFPEFLCKNYWLNSFHTWHLSSWGELLDPFTFSCS